MRSLILWGVLLICFISNVKAQEEDTCSKLGAWVWHLEITGFENHQLLADSLVSLGVKRVYVKVADGGVNEVSWPEIVDEVLVNIYKTRGLEVFAWSYNYPENDEAQAAALTKAAETGYQGYVVDVETEFDGDSQALNNLFGAFAQSRNELLNNQIIDDQFKLYCTTWGNPKDHNFYISVIDPYVDGYLAQTYVEQWGPSYVENLEYWIGVGEEEYKEMGATKPVHHILAMQDGNVSVERVNTFIATAGAETSIWRVPGGSVDASIWNTWNEIDWDRDFCELTSISNEEHLKGKLYPNPFIDLLTLEPNDLGKTFFWQLYDAYGGLIIEKEINEITTIDLTDLPSGVYFSKMKYEEYVVVLTVLKL